MTATMSNSSRPAAHPTAHPAPSPAANRKRAVPAAPAARLAGRRNGGRRLLARLFLLVFLHPAFPLLGRLLALKRLHPLDVALHLGANALFAEGVRGLTWMPVSSRRICWARSGSGAPSGACSSCFRAAFWASSVGWAYPPTARPHPPAPGRPEALPCRAGPAGPAPGRPDPAPLGRPPGPGPAFWVSTAGRRYGCTRPPPGSSPRYSWSWYRAYSAPAVRPPGPAGIMRACTAVWPLSLLSPKGAPQ